MPRLELVTLIAAPIERVFDLARDIDLHQKSQADHREKAVAGRTSGRIEAGEEVTWEAIHFGIRQRLTSRIVAMERPVYFRDEMIAGVFKRLAHDHCFAAESAGTTRMTDVFDYAAPLRLLGRVADRLFLERYMFRLLEKRNATLKQVAETNGTSPQL